MTSVWTLICRRHCSPFSKSSTSSLFRDIYSTEIRTIRYAEVHRAFSSQSRHDYAPNKRPRQQTHQPRTQLKNTRSAEAIAKPRQQSTPAQVTISVQDVYAIFGKGVPLKQGSDVVRELQDRRLSGSLVDLGLDVSKIAPDIPELQAAKALEWLRQKHPLDEALAAERYAEDADEKYRAELEAKAADSFLYQKKQQEEENNASLAIENWSEDRKALWREKLAKAEALEKEHAKEQAEVRLAVVQQQIELAQRRDDKLARWDELEKSAELDTEALTDETRSAWSRLGKPLAFGTVSLVALAFLLDPSYVIDPQQGLARQAWTAPDSLELTPSMVTCIGITAINLVVLIAWRNPALWYSMNRLFLLSAGNPNTFSVLGSVFSHQRWIMHLAANTTLLFALGMPLHDEIGRANFLTVYLASGILASCSSLTFHVLKRDFLMASLGASGAVMGIYGAFFTVQPQRAFYIPYFDKTITYDSWMAIVGFLILEAGMFWRTKGLVYDHITHLTGLAAGVMYGYKLRPKNSATRSTPKEKESQVQVDDQG